VKNDELLERTELPEFLARNNYPGITLRMLEAWCCPSRNIGPPADARTFYRRGGATFLYRPDRVLRWAAERERSSALAAQRRKKLPKIQMTAAA
jgi:hypothetical protein